MAHTLVLSRISLTNAKLSSSGTENTFNPGQTWKADDMNRPNSLE